MMGRASVANCDSNVGACDAAIRGYEVVDNCRGAECPREALAGALTGLAGALLASGRDRAGAYVVAREAGGEYVRMGKLGRWHRSTSGWRAIRDDGRRVRRDCAAPGIAASFWDAALRLWLRGLQAPLGRHAPDGGAAARVPGLRRDDD